MKEYLTVLLALLLFSIASNACTLAIISGEHTPDGRPILWKHRDTGVLDNKVIIFEGGQYKAIGLINSDDETPQRIWIGFNEAGFAIMNSVAYNLNQGDTIQMPHMTGQMMREALLTCATVDEFERFLLEHDKPMGVRTNYGVIDAHGNAAYFETDHYSYQRINVDDKAVAPHGYIVRTNFAFTGIANEGAGYIRFETAERLLYRASGSNNLSIPYIMENMATSVWNSYSDQDARHAIHLSEMESKFMYFQDCINRYSSSSSVAIQGVRPGDSPALTTMWAMVGFPLSSVVVPLWITPENTLPIIVTAPGLENAPICDWALELKNRMIPSTRGSTRFYIDAVKVFNADGTGVTQQLIPVSREVMQQTLNMMEQWEYPPQRAVNDHYRWLDGFISDKYRELFGIPAVY